jgi:hypothetical protein
MLICKISIWSFMKAFSWYDIKLFDINIRIPPPCVFLSILIIWKFDIKNVVELKLEFNQVSHKENIFILFFMIKQMTSLTLLLKLQIFRNANFMFSDWILSIFNILSWPQIFLNTLQVLILLLGLLKILLLVLAWAKCRDLSLYDLKNLMLSIKKTYYLFCLEFPKILDILYYLPYGFHCNSCISGFLNHKFDVYAYLMYISDRFYLICNMLMCAQIYYSYFRFS